MTKKPPLTLVREVVTTLDPPRSLGKPGRSLWDRIMREYAIRDAGGFHLADAWVHPADLVAIGALGAEEAAAK